MVAVGQQPVAGLEPETDSLPSLTTPIFTARLSPCIPLVSAIRTHDCAVESYTDDGLAAMTGVDTWADAFNKSAALVSNMTVEEKVSLTTGGSSNTGCVGYIPSIPRLNFTGLCLNDAGNGLRATDFVSGWPSGIHVAASWNKNLTRMRAVGMGGEFRTKGVNIALGPVVGPVGRTVTGGRNWEGFSVDPYLSGVLAAETVSGIQSVGVITSTKVYNH
jgi:beta-glucosidase